MTLSAQQHGTSAHSNSLMLAHKTDDSRKTAPSPEVGPIRRRGALPFEAITQALVKQLLHFDPDTGIFTRKVSKGGQAVGSIAGNDWSKYRSISIAGHNCLAHRAAWLYVFGAWPKHHVDHINGIGTDNRIANLRDVSRTVNMQNRTSAAKGNASGLLGAHKYGKRWTSRIKDGERYVRLGMFDTPEEAHSAYLQQKRLLHEGCTI